MKPVILFVFFNHHIIEYLPSIIAKAMSAEKPMIKIVMSLSLVELDNLGVTTISLGDSILLIFINT